MVTMPLAQDEPEGIFFSRISIEFHAYWQRLAQRRGGIPLRSDFDPADIPRLLPFLFIVERIQATGRYFFRLSGTGIRDIMGFENTNHFLDELLTGEDLAAVSAMFDQVLGQGVCIRSVEGLTYSDRSYQRAEILRLPLRHNDGEQRLVVGCLSRLEDDTWPALAGGPVRNKQVIRIENEFGPGRDV